MIIRELSINDDKIGFLETLNELSPTPQLNEALFKKLVLNLGNKRVFVAVINNEICGTASLILDRKFSRGGSIVGLVEDVVVKSKYRSCGIASKLMNYISDYAKKKGVLKLRLTCNNDLSDFYNKFGFKQGGICMTHEF